MDFQQQTWVKSDDGVFIPVDKASHVVTDPNCRAYVYVVGKPLMAAGTFSSPRAFFDAMMRGLSPEDVDG